MATPTLDTVRLAGQKVGPTAVTVDARWLMAYAAALGETDPRYYDTRAPGGPVAHPLFPVCYEWPLAQALRAKTMDETVAQRGVHAFHNLVVHRAPRAGEGLRVRASVVSVQTLRAGTLVVIRFSTTDRTGVAVTTTDHGSIYRGIELRGAEVAPAGSSRRMRFQSSPVFTAHDAHGRLPVGSTCSDSTQPQASTQ